MDIDYTGFNNFYVYYILIKYKSTITNLIPSLFSSSTEGEAKNNPCYDYSCYDYSCYDYKEWTWKSYGYI